MAKIYQNSGLVITKKDGFIGTEIHFPAFYNLHIDNFKVSHVFYKNCV